MRYDGRNLFLQHKVTLQFHAHPTHEHKYINKVTVALQANNNGQVAYLGGKGGSPPWPPLNADKNVHESGIWIATDSSP